MSKNVEQKIFALAKQILPGAMGNTPPSHSGEPMAFVRSADVPAGKRAMDAGDWLRTDV